MSSKICKQPGQIFLGMGKDVTAVEISMAAPKTQQFCILQQFHFLEAKIKPGVAKIKTRASASSCTVRFVARSFPVAKKTRQPSCQGVAYGWVHTCTMGESNLKKERELRSMLG